MAHLTPRPPLEFTTSISTTFVTSINTNTNTLPPTQPTTTSSYTDPYPMHCPSPLRYQYAIAILSTIIGVTLLLLAFIFLYLKPKKWEAKGAASRDAELHRLKEENDEWKKSNSGYARMATAAPVGVGVGVGPGPGPVPVSGLGWGLGWGGFGPRGWL